MKFLPFFPSKKNISFLFLLLIPLGTGFSEPLSNFAFYNLKRERTVLSDSLREFSKKDILILNFTGSTCQPCKEQVPVLQRLTKEANLSSRGEFRIRFWVIFVGDDFLTGQEYSKILKLEKDTEVLIDPLSASYSQIKIVGLPTVLVLDANQEVLLRTEGFTKDGTNTFENFLHSLEGRK